MRASIWGGAVIPRRRRVGRPRASVNAVKMRRLLRGKGFFGDLWRGVKNAAVGAKDLILKPAGSALKEILGHAAGQTLGRISPSLGRAAQRGIYQAGEQLGVGRRRRVGRPRKRGGAILQGARRRRRVVPKRRVAKLRGSGLLDFLLGGAPRKRVVRRRRM